ncbi:MAG TPA: sugar transferase [Chitinophaga sp.]|nr:sugar transferase [Chitinophaga sp.]
MYKSCIKPVTDFIIALVAFSLLLPVFLVCTVLLFIVNNGAPFFLQRRPGKGERIFNVIKFKTMTDRRDGNGMLLPDHQRLTPVGKFIRKTSLDEIPQLLNVIKGDMSLVGPRPLLVEYLPLYNEHQKRRHDVKPGITGWAQVKGRNAITWQQKFEYDVWYVNHLSFKLDLEILVATVFKVIKSEGINQEGQATAERFRGQTPIEN